MTDTPYIEVTHYELPYSTFDADNHLYETQEALTKFLPAGYDGIIRYVEVGGRTKLAIRNQISNYIPNPTFERVAVPGGHGYDITKQGRPGEFGHRSEFRKVIAMPGIDAFFEPEARLELMKEMGIDRTLLWPTLATGLEERLWDDPDALVVVIHALNRWMAEHWTFGYSESLYACPMVSLAAGNEPAIAEIEFLHAQGAKIFLVRLGTVSTWKGRRSFALPEFDPFWQRVQELGLVVGMHSVDAGYTRYVNEWEGIAAESSLSKNAPRANPAFVELSSEKSNVVDGVASIIGHGLATRFPDLRFLPVEFPSEWIRPFYRKLHHLRDTKPGLFAEDPVDAFNRSIYVHAFHDPNPKELIDLGIPADHIMFGSDFPHPEGMANPLAYSQVVKDLPPEDQALIMGGSIEKAMRVGRFAGA